MRKRVCDDETKALISRLDEAERNLNEIIVRITEEFRSTDPREIDSQWLSKVIFLFHHPEKNPDAKGFFQLSDHSIFEAVPECRKPVPRGQNTITCEFNKIRAFFNWCRREGYTKNYPFDNFDIAPELYGTPIYKERTGCHPQC